MFLSSVVILVACIVHFFLLLAREHDEVRIAVFISDLLAREVASETLSEQGKYFLDVIVAFLERTPESLSQKS